MKHGDIRKIQGLNLVLGEFANPHGPCGAELVHACHCFVVLL